MKNLGAAMAGGHGKRREHDFYPTPEECTRALLEAEGGRLNAMLPVWEPACGDGAICKVLEAQGYRTVATDLIKRGYGKHDINFLDQNEAMAPQIVTNPPFVLAAEFIAKGIELGVPYMAMLVKSQYWHAARRLPLFESHAPAVVYPLTWRPDFDGRGSPTMDCSWIVWLGKPACVTEYRPLPRPPGAKDLLR